ncbi:GGDEF domain-containing protein [Marinobacter sp.]|uniref:GGDEF domain-containing protein n=1 Tax=Marinobacter sp. TaxID=50741 RepID=UPI00384AD146
MQDFLSQELKRLLSDQDVTTLFQPIINTDNKNVFGYEALSRGPSDSPLHPAQMLFETAERCNRTLELEALCLRIAARTWSGQGAPQKLFVNVSPAKLMPAEFEPLRLKNLLAVNGLKASDIVIEISERYPTTDPCGLQKTLAWLRAEGFLIAIDDLGSGYSGLKLWSELKPDFVKIDRHFIRDIQDDLVKREFLRSVVELADRLGCTLIAEGVETDAEFRVVSGMGISLIQGFLFGRPKPIPTACLDPLEVHPLFSGQLPQREKAGTLCTHIEPIAGDATLQHAWARLQDEPGMFALPVVDNGRPLGLVHKWRVLETFSTPYGRALYEKRRVSQMLNSDALVVDYDMPLEEVSQRLIDDDVHYLKQHFIITRNGEYVGLGATRSLLQQITARKIEKARYANPLTLLPGNVPIQQALATRARNDIPFTLMYFDINAFKPLNDLLGYRVGDQVILLLSDLLLEHFCADTDFVGHIGGDDFVVITSSHSAASLARSVQGSFIAKTRHFYTADVLQSNCVESEDRNGQVSRFPLVSLSAGLVEAGPADSRTADQLSDAASFAKKRAKTCPGFCFTDPAAKPWVTNLAVRA